MVAQGVELGIHYTRTYSKKQKTLSVLYVCFAGDRTGSAAGGRLQPYLFVHEGCSLSLWDVQAGPEISSEKTYTYIYIGDMGIVLGY